MKKRFVIAAGLGVMFSTYQLSSLAWSQAAPADLVAAYRAGVAAAKCDLGLDSAKSSKLGDAVQRIEQRSGLGQGDLDALWTKTEEEADADNDGFCAKGAKSVDKVISSAK